MSRKIAGFAHSYAQQRRREGLRYQIAILSSTTPVKDRDIYKAVTPTGINPDGRVNAGSLAFDLAFYASQGLIVGKVELAALIDVSFVESALKALGPYRP